MQEITNDVFIFPQPAAAGDASIHPSGVALDDGLILFDTGYEHELETLEAELDDAGYSMGDVELIVVTHQDGDHAGSLRDVKQQSGATVLAHQNDAPYISGEKDPIKSGDDRYPPVEVDIELVDGEVIRSNAGPVHVIATPGHTPGHISLYFSEHNLLIAGDALTADDRLQGPSEQWTPDMDRALESVARLTEFDIDTVLCYHGGFVEEGTERLNEISSSSS